MSVNKAHMTKLEAVNDMLWSIGESPVQSLSSGLGDAEQAETLLDRVSRRVQMRGWHCNTNFAKTITKNASDQFAMAENTLKVDTVNHSGSRKTSTPTPSAHVNAVLRRSSDDTKWLLYDIDNNSETWDSLTELTVDEVFFEDFANLTPALQHYVWAVAARRFQTGAMASVTLDQVTRADIAESEMDAIQEDLENSDINLIRDNKHVRSIAWRNNPNAT